jgi:hypothetical protein
VLHLEVQQLRNSQFCGVPGKTILDAISSIRDVLALSECTGTPLCVLTLDFQSAFDRISQDYLFTILRQYGISQWFIDRLYALYDQATASAQINGHMAGPIPICSGVKQGRPLSMVLYAFCLHPLLLSLGAALPAFPLGPGRHCSPVIAYADDITVFVTQPADFSKIRHSIRCFELATGARLNAWKSKALEVSTWTAQPTILGIDFSELATILGMTFRHTIARSISDSWSAVICAVQAQAQKAYGRIMCLAQQIQYVQMCLLAKIWYTAQIFLLTHIHAQQLTTICAWFLWQGSTFRVPMTTLQLSKYEGGWDFPNIESKCKALL